MSIQMKRCPTCNRTYGDDTFAFCLEDGALLSAPFDSERTLVLQTPPFADRGRDATQLDSPQTTPSLSRTKKLYFDFWNGFKEFCKAEGTSLDLHKQSTRFYFLISLGRSNFILSIGASQQKSRLGCEIYLSGDSAKKAFKLLEMDKQAIEGETGPLEWQELPDKRDCRIVLYRQGVDIADKSTWNAAYAWLKFEAELFHKTFLPRIKALPRKL